MYSLYDNIFALCKEHGITPGGLCGELGFRRSVLSDLKNGRKKTLDTTTLVKISDYFSVSVDFLLNGSETEKKPTPEGEPIRMEDVKAAFFRGADPTLTEEEMENLWEDARSYMMYKISQRSPKKKNEP